MSIQFANNEKVFRAYDYASLGIKKKATKSDTFKSLIVTNKRLIHEEICTRRGQELTIRREMPVSDAKYINTLVTKTSKPALLVWCIIFAILGAVSFVLFGLNVLPDWNLVFLGAGVATVLIAAIFLGCYIGSHKTILICNVSTDHALYPVMGIAAESSNGDKKEQEGKKKKKKKNTEEKLTLQIRVNNAIAKQLVDELGAVILNAIAYDPASEVEEPETVTEEAEEVGLPVDEISEDAEPEEPKAEPETETEEETVAEATESENNENA